MAPYLQRSQAVKEEIQADSGLVAAVRAHIQDEKLLKLIGRGTNNLTYRVGQTKSGLWIALRENMRFKVRPEDYGYYAIAYNTYCLDAEKVRNPPSFCICGLVGEDRPFLLVEDVSEGGELQPIYKGGGESRIPFQRGKEGEIVYRDVDLGIDNLYEYLDEKTKEAIFDGTFDINALKYFKPKHRLDIS